MIAAIICAVQTTLVLTVLENFRPARKLPLKALLPNLLYLVPFMLLSDAAFRFGTWGMATALGASGVINIPSTGAWFFVGLAAYVVLMDLAEWAFHVGQHRIPILWQLHSLHHSDQELNVSTTSRHHWLDRGLKALACMSQSIWSCMCLPKSS